MGAIPTNFVSDIAGTSPKKHHRSISGDFNRYSTDDITDSKPKKPIRSCILHGSFDTLDVRDINSASHCKQRGNRCTNPLDPIYTVSKWNGSVETDEARMTIGPISESKPAKRIPDKSNTPPGIIDRNIPQRYVGTLPHSTINKGPVITRPMPTGSRADTLKKGVVSRRETNPLAPEYIFLDGDRDHLSAVLTH
jgi:hypothetical protein